MIKKSKNHIVRLLVSSKTELNPENIYTVLDILYNNKFITKKETICNNIMKLVPINRNKLFTLRNDNTIITEVGSKFALDMINHEIGDVSKEFDGYYNTNIKYSFSQNDIHIIGKESYKEYIAWNNVKSSFSLKQKTDITYDINPSFDNIYPITKDIILYTLQKWFYTVTDLLTIKDPLYTNQDIYNIYNKWLVFDYYLHTQTPDKFISINNNQEALDILETVPNNNLYMIIFGANILVNDPIVNPLIHEYDFIINRYKRPFSRQIANYIFVIVDQFEFGPDKKIYNHPFLTYFILYKNLWDLHEEPVNYNSKYHELLKYFPNINKKLYSINYEDLFIKEISKYMIPQVIYHSQCKEGDI